MSDALRTVFSEFGFDFDFKALDEADKRVGAFIEKLRAAGIAPKAAPKPPQAPKPPTAEKPPESTPTAPPKGAKAPEANSEKATKDFDEFLKRVKDRAFEQLGQRIKTAWPALDGLAKRFNLSGEAMGKVFVGASVAAIAAITGVSVALFSFANSFAAASEQLRDTAADAGVTTSELQSLRHAGVQSGVGADRLEHAMQSLHQQMQAARLTGGGVNTTLRRLGVESRTAGRGIRSASDVMNDLAQSFDRIQNPIRKDRIGVRLFGQDWYRLREVMHGGAGGIAALRAEMEALGGGTAPEAVEISRQYTRATERLSVAQDSLRSVLAVGILPALTWVTNRAAELTGWWSRMTRGTNLAQVALVALGVAGIATAGALIVAWLPVALPFIKIALLIALVVAVLDDLVTLANGGNSVFGEMIDTLLGTGAAAQMVTDLRDAWRAVVDTVKEGVDAVREFLSLRPGGGGSGPVRGYVQNAAGAPGTAAIRSRIAPAALAANQRPSTTQAGAAPPPYAVAPPPLRAVAAPGGGHRTIVRQTSRTNHNTFHLAGPDAHQLAGQVGEILERQAREQRDADHPQPGDDD
jgi:hypothetical protein